MIRPTRLAARAAPSSAQIMLSAKYQHASDQPGENGICRGAEPPRMMGIVANTPSTDNLGNVDRSGFPKSPESGPVYDACSVIGRRMDS